MSAATDTPSSYLQAINDVAEIIKTLPIESVTKAYEAMDDELKKPENHKKLAEEVKTLADDARNLGNLFQGITLKLESIDKKEYPGVEKLAPAWKGLHMVSLSRKCI